MSGQANSLRSALPRRGRLGKLAFVAIAVSMAMAAHAEEAWREYTYPDKRLLIHFPAEPAVNESSYPAAVSAGKPVSASATAYTVTKDGAFYSVTVANLSGTAADDDKALEAAVDAIRAKFDVQLDVPVSMANSPCGRNLGYQDKDGTLNYITLFYNPSTKLFYDIRASVAPDAQAEHGADAIHFHQSLSFLPDPNATKENITYPEEWREYVYADPGFSIRFPGDPSVEKQEYRTEAGIKVPATVYSSTVDDTVYRVTTVGLWQTEADGTDALDQAVRVLKRTGDVVADDSINISNGQCGRDVALAKPGGGLSRTKLFFPSSQHRLYFVEVARKGAPEIGKADGDRWFRSSFAIAKPQEQ